MGHSACTFDIFLLPIASIRLIYVAPSLSRFWSDAARIDGSFLLCLCRGLPRLLFFLEGGGGGGGGGRGDASSDLLDIYRK